MSPAAFDASIRTWAREILDAPRYTMPNGRDSHTVAAEVLHDLDDQFIGVAHITQDGRLIHEPV